MARSDRNRGLAPEDAAAFGPEAQLSLQTAVLDYSWLLTRGYAGQAALKLVGDRHQLTARQRKAVYRCACTDTAREVRYARQRTLAQLGGKPLQIDGFNLLITVETALSGGLVLQGRDKALRDLASVHGSYRTVSQTEQAIQRIGARLQRAGVGPVHWWFDRPVGNSGRLRAHLEEVAHERGWPWTAQLVNNPDRELAAADCAVATSDAWILDHCRAWVDVASEIIRDPVDPIPQVRLVDLAKPPV